MPSIRLREVKRELRVVEETIKRAEAVISNSEALISEATVRNPRGVKERHRALEGQSACGDCDGCKLHKMEEQERHLANNIHWQYSEILGLLPRSENEAEPPVSCREHHPRVPNSENNMLKHGWIVHTIRTLLQEHQEASKELLKVQKKQGEAGRKNEELKNKIVKREKSLQEKDSIHITNQQTNDKHVQELQGQLRSLELKLDAKDETIRKEQQTTLRVKGDWQKKLQKEVDNNSKLEKQLLTELSAHKVTRLDLAATQTDLDKARTKIASYTSECGVNSTEFKELKAKNEELTIKVLSLRSNDLAEKTRINSAVRRVELAKDEEIVQLRHMYQNTSRELAELRDTHQKELAVAARERQNETRMQVALQRSTEQVLDLERERIGVLEEEVRVLTIQKSVAEQWAMWAASSMQ